MNEVRRIALQSAIELVTKTGCQVFSAGDLLIQVKEIENYLNGFIDIEEEFDYSSEYEVKTPEDFRRVVSSIHWDEGDVSKVRILFKK